MNNRLLHPPTIELFSFWMSEELLALEAQHAPQASAKQITKVLH